MTAIRLKSPEVEAAIRWFSRQREGRDFFIALDNEVRSIPSNDPCALQENRARRIFASELLAMAVSDAPEDGTTSVGRSRNPSPERVSRRKGPAGR